MEIELSNDFKELLKLLHARGVKYLLIGGYAVGFHGYPRSTKDMDIWVEPSPDNARRIVAALREFGFGMPELDEDLFLQDKSIVRMGVPPQQIEITTRISGVEFAECFSERVTAMIEDVQVNLINLKHLKKNKKASGRYRDLDDLEHLP